MSTDTLSPTIHLIDDDQAVRDSLALLIGTVGLRVQPWSDPQAFLNTFDREAIGAIVLDVRMPGVDGFGLLEWLRQNRPDRMKHFLFITRNLLLAQHDWAKESTHYQVNCIRSLKSIICCFNVSDLCKFLPKVLFHCETFLEL